VNRGASIACVLIADALTWRAATVLQTQIA
jgi:hypothetical protein